jgi:hypothetical protein
MQQIEKGEYEKSISFWLCGVQNNRPLARAQNPTQTPQPPPPYIAKSAHLREISIDIRLRIGAKPLSRLKSQIPAPILKIRVPIHSTQPAILD